jgi:hypothetical protein
MTGYFSVRLHLRLKSGVQCGQQSNLMIVGEPCFYLERRVGQHYIDRFTAVLEQLLTAAGAALASVLNHRSSIIHPP